MQSTLYGQRQRKVLCLAWQCKANGTFYVALTKEVNTVSVSASASASVSE